MKPATTLRIHSIISSALDLAVRYDWVGRNVSRNASPPHPRKREPDPPTPEQAARLLNLVFAEDEDCLVKGGSTSRGRPRTATGDGYPSTR